jgi:hypothetical protein
MLFYSGLFAAVSHHCFQLLDGMNWLKQKLWAWPDGLVWKLTHRISVQSRQEKFALFLREMKPGPETRILDVGVSGRSRAERAMNFLEEWYAHPERITAVGLDDLRGFQQRYPKVSVVQADGRHLPFADKTFDIVFSNAVVEHVGGRTEQEAFVRECLQVGKALFLTTPSRSFPIESHTMIPFAHWFPDAFRNAVYRALGRVQEGTPGYLTLLSTRAFKALFPRECRVRIVRQRLFGLASVLIAIVRV